MGTELTPRLKLAIGRDTAALRQWVNSELGRTYMDWWMTEVDPSGRWAASRTGQGTGIQPVVDQFEKAEKADEFFKPHPQFNGLVSGWDLPSNARHKGNGVAGPEGQICGGLARSVVKSAIRSYNKAVHGRMYYVTPEMGDQAARRMVRRTEAFIEPHELVTPTGIVWLPVTHDMNFQKQQGPTMQEDITPAIAWNLDGDKITIFWICDGAWNHASNSIRWLASEGFWTNSEFYVDEEDSMLTNTKICDPPPGLKGGTEFEQIMDLACSHGEMWQIMMNEAQEAWKYGPSLDDALNEGKNHNYRGSNGPQRLIPYHFWSPRMNTFDWELAPADGSSMGPTGEASVPLLRPDQPGAPSPDEFGPDHELWWNENGTSTLRPFPHEPETEEQIADRTADQWTMIAFACEVIRMLGEDYLYAEDAYPSEGAPRDVQRGLKKRGIDKSTALRVYTLRKPVEEGLRREGRYLSRGPLTTRHHRMSHWRGNQGKAGDRTCRHVYRPHKDEYDWRICDECGRVEHRVTDTDVGPEHAPFIKDRSIGVLRR